MKDLHERDLKISQDFHAKSLLYDLRKQIEEEVDGIEEAFRRLKPLQDAKSSSFSRFRAKIVWVFLDEQDLKELLARLEPIKLSVTLLENTFILNIQMAIWDESCASGRQLDDDKKQEIKYLKRQIKTLKRECKEAQRAYEAVRSVRVARDDTAFHHQAIQNRFIEVLMERIEDFATEQVAASTAIMADIEGRTGTSTTETETSNNSIVQPPQPDAEEAVNVSDPVEIGTQPDTESPQRPQAETPELHPDSPVELGTRDIHEAEYTQSLNSVELPSEAGLSEQPEERSVHSVKYVVPSEIVMPNQSEVEENNPLTETAEVEQEVASRVGYTWVIHDYGTHITEGWGRPQDRLSAVVDTNSIISRHSSASELH